MMKYIGILCAGLMVVGCANPYIDSRREAGQKELVGQSTPDRLAVCYSPLTDSVDIAQKMAQEECQKKNKKAVAVADGVKYFNCALFAANTAFFKCQ